MILAVRASHVREKGVEKNAKQRDIWLDSQKHGGDNSFLEELPWVVHVMKGLGSLGST